MKQVIVGVLVLTLSYPASSVAGFTGNDWNKFNDFAKTVYVGGVMDAFQFNAIFVQIPEDADNIHDGQKILYECISKKEMTYRQMGAIVKKYMENNPEKWNELMPILIYYAFVDVCKEQK